VEITEFKKMFLRLLKEDEEFRLAVAGLIGFEELLKRFERHEEELRRVWEAIEKLRQDLHMFMKEQEKRWEENNRRWEENNRRWEENNKKWEMNWRLWEENNKRWEENNKRWEENWRRWEENSKRWEENNKRWEEAYKRFEAIERKLLEHDKRFEALMRRMDLLEKRIDRKITMLGARWGLETEKSFRRAVKGLVEEVLGRGKVEKWKFYDEKGEVYGYPSEVEIDLLIRDEAHILVEVKASASSGDVVELWKIGGLYQRVTGIRPRLVIITPFIDERAMKTAKELGVEVYSKI